MYTEDFLKFITIKTREGSSDLLINAIVAINEVAVGTEIKLLNGDTYVTSLRKERIWELIHSKTNDFEKSFA